jgi:predicted XRE-type DNA-binding protein
MTLAAKAKRKGEERLRYDNPFEATTRDPAEAADLQCRAEMMIALRDYFKFVGWNQAQIATALNIPQPRVSELMTGKIRMLSSATLNTYMARLGYRIAFSFAPLSATGKPRIEARLVEFA